MNVKHVILFMMIIVWLFVPVFITAGYALIHKGTKFKTFKAPVFMLIWMVSGFFFISAINQKYQLNYTPVAHKVTITYDKDWRVLKRQQLY